MPNEDPKKSKSTPPRQEKPQSGSNLLWYLIVGTVLFFIVFALWDGNDGNRKEMALSDFLQSVRSGVLHRDNVYELTLGPIEVTFQDQPKPKSGETPTTEIKQSFIPVVGIDDQTRRKMTDLLDEKEITYSGDKLTTDWTTLLSYLVPSLLILLLLIFVMRRISGAGSAMSFGRSRGRMYAQEDIEITFNDVAGIEEAVEELREIVEFLRVPGKYQALGGRIPRGVLLVGPPGTGKTLLAKAVAGEAGVPFFSLSGSDFVEMFVGVGAARVRDMFQQAGQRAPAIIFIDELDALGKVRGSGMPGGHDEREQTLNALLVEMDGFASDQSVIVMAATNRPETLDPALMRPGRFDRHVLVDRPDIKGREAILKVHGKKVKLDDHIDMKRLAKLTPGFVGADLANLVNEAALLAARRDKKRVPMSCFEDGIERVMAGLEKTSRIIVEEVKHRVAYHECGHALVACSLPNTDPVHKISIIPRGMGALGYTLQLPEDDRELLTQSELEARITVLLGGIAAEEIVYNETSTGAQNDLQRATNIARRMVTEFGMSPRLGRMFYSDVKHSPFLAGAATGGGDAPHSEDTIREIDLEVKRIVEECGRTAHEILTEQIDTLEHLTKDLIEVETMNSDHLNRILDEHRTGPKLKPGTHAVSAEEVPTEDPGGGETDLNAADGA